MNANLENHYKEKRLYPRRSWRTKVVFENEFGEGIIYLYSKDLSLGGMFLEESPPLRVGTQLFLSFEIPESKKPIQVTAQIVRVVNDIPSDVFTNGIGIRFVDFAPQSLEVLSQFLST